ncbi:hypothetical protein [Aquiflexum lacus]|uniref:hypothetical protein n=1 Tax=Aquiflexum lacus TaxID=2483805 RepID=UPI001895495D|nr:hypothetical protein [Aquiflexum lacus]
MDGKERALDNVLIERFWKSIKYDCIYLNRCNYSFELVKGIQTHFEYYNRKYILPPNGNKKNVIGAR